MVWGEAPPQPAAGADFFGAKSFSPPQELRDPRHDHRSRQGHRRHSAARVPRRERSGAIGGRGSTRVACPMCNVTLPLLGTAHTQHSRVFSTHARRRPARPQGPHGVTVEHPDLHRRRHSCHFTALWPLASVHCLATHSWRSAPISARLQGRVCTASDVNVAPARFVHSAGLHPSLGMYVQLGN